MNICIFMGRLTAEPELRMTTNGVAVTRFTLAVDRKRTKGNAATDFFDIIAWRERAEFAAKYLHKGQRVSVQGEMQTRSYTDRNGVKRKAVELSADQIYFADSRQEAAQAEQYAPDAYGGYPDGEGTPWADGAAE